MESIFPDVTPVPGTLTVHEVPAEKVEDEGKILFKNLSSEHGKYLKF